MRVWIILGTICWLGMGCAGSVWAQRDSIPKGYPQSLTRDLNELLSDTEQNPHNVEVLVRLADVYMNLGDDLFVDDQQRVAAYEEGMKVAWRALKLDDTNSDAHFFYAANLGNATRIRAMPAGIFKVREILRHVCRAIELQPDHVPALQMLGGMLAELPWFAGGDTEEAFVYLNRAIKVDSNYTNARILLAKLYIKEGRADDAREQLQAVITANTPHYPYTWLRKFRPEAQELLSSLTGK